MVDLSRRTLKELFERLEGKGLSPSTLNIARAAINNVLEYALDLELIEHNVMRDVRLGFGKAKALDVDPLSEPEAERLLEAAKGFLGGHYYPSILCALRTGMRIGEMEALQFGDIDFHSRFIEVRRSHRRGRITDTKNRKRRQVDMTPHLAETLKALLTLQKKKALKEGRPVPEWVFANRNGGMLNREAFKNALEVCLKAAGLKRIRVHDLRHSYATIRLLRGHNIGDVSYQLGHSRISITYDIYAHWVPGRFKTEVDDLDNPIKKEESEAHPNAPLAHPEKNPSRISQGIQ
jgi:integrase